MLERDQGNLGSIAMNVIGKTVVGWRSPASSACRLGRSRPLALCNCLLLFAFCLMPSYASGQEVVDKTIATVNGGVQTDLITYSDLLWQIALQPGSSLASPNSETLNGTLRLIEDQRLILQEAQKLPTISPTAQEIQTALQELVKQFPSRAELEQRMTRAGLTSEKLNEILEQRVRIEKYLDFRFRSFIVIAQKDVADYYSATWVPRFQKKFPGRIVPKLEDARSEIEKTLTESKVESDIDTFLDTARDRAEIVILNPL
jgi:hypothetical protein